MNAKSLLIIGAVSVGAYMVLSRYNSVRPAIVPTRPNVSANSGQRLADAIERLSRLFSTDRTMPGSQNRGSSIGTPPYVPELAIGTGAVTSRPFMFDGLTAEWFKSDQYDTPIYTAN